jgi:hypothetical protein
MLGFLNGRVLLGIDFPWTSAHPKQGINSTESNPAEMRMTLSRLPTLLFISVPLLFYFSFF